MITIKLIWVGGVIERATCESWDMSHEGILHLHTGRHADRYIPFTALLEWAVE